MQVFNIPRKFFCVTVITYIDVQYTIIPFRFVHPKKAQDELRGLGTYCFNSNYTDDERENNGNLFVTNEQMFFQTCAGSLFEIQRSKKLVKKQQQQLRIK
ncbi:Hypothetical_protein [Hexamita inflata]|uniref:Hypothetical_protein n=1 Tax=Hexamita inflata TaxID=28002 RepID=A0ABP1GVN5_9EUKA